MRKNGTDIGQDWR